MPNVTDESRVEVHGLVSDGEVPLSAVVLDTVGGLVQLTEGEVAPGEARTVTVDTPHGTASVQVPAISNAGTRVRVAGVSAQDSPGEMREATAGRDQALMVGADDDPLPPPPGFGVDAMNPPAERPPEAEPEPVEEFGLNEDGQWAPQPPDQPREFGWWNADRNFRTACVRGMLATPQGACAVGRVTATGPDGLSSRDNTGVDEPPMTPEDCGFDCGDGTCIAADRACNRAQDCANGSDEADAVCGNPDNCCTATRVCPGETGSSALTLAAAVQAARRFAPTPPMAAAPPTDQIF